MLEKEVFCFCFFFWGGGGRGGGGRMGQENRFRKFRNVYLLCTFFFFSFFSFLLLIHHGGWAGGSAGSAHTWNREKTVILATTNKSGSSHLGCMGNITTVYFAFCSVSFSVSSFFLFFFLFFFWPLLARSIVSNLQLSMCIFARWKEYVNVSFLHA